MKKMLVVLSLLVWGVAQAEINVKNYGFIKAGLSQSDKGLASFGADGFRAPTEVINLKATTVANEDKKGQMSLQSMQSRWGLLITNEEGVTGRFEFDAAGTNGSPDVATGRVRVRQANISYKNGDCELFAGQKWVTFSGLNPHGVNMVAAGLRSGNSGFIGQELGYSHNFADLKVTVAAGNKGYTPNPATSIVELGTPLLTARLDYTFGDHSVGAAYIPDATLKSSTINPAVKDSKAGGYVAFVKSKIADVELLAEYFSGSNLGSLGFFTLASVSGAEGKEHQEMGYFVSVKYAMGEHSFFAGYGADMVDKVKEDYATGALVKNSVIRLGTELNLAANLHAYLAHERFTSGYLKAAGEDKIDNSQGALSELGMIFRF